MKQYPIIPQASKAGRVILCSQHPKTIITWDETIFNNTTGSKGWTRHTLSCSKHLRTMITWDQTISNNTTGFKGWTGLHTLSCSKHLRTIITWDQTISNNTAVSKVGRDITWVVLSVTECIVCVQGHDPLTFSFLSFFLFWLGGNFMAPII